MAEKYISFIFGTLHFGYRRFIQDEPHQRMGKDNPENSNDKRKTI
jgi:hypothetical protein